MLDIVFLAGSLRSASFNRRLARSAARRMAELAPDARAEVIDLASYVLPLYDGDFEAEHGVPAAAKALAARMSQADGIVFACPEYNASVTPLLKNTIDWVSRVKGEGGAMTAFVGKTAALASASPGALGGLRGLGHVREILTTLGVLVLPDQVAVGRAHEAFDEHGDLADAGNRARLDALLENLVGLAAARREHGRNQDSSRS